MHGTDSSAPKNSPIMENLRESTKELHDHAEANEFQRLLGSGKVPVKQYCIYLEQLFAMHAKLAALLADAKDGNAALAKVVKSHHLDLSCISSDLDYFDKRIEDVKPLQATKELTAAMESTAARDATSLLGYLYVLEGSTNGAKFMAKNLRAGLSLPENAGASYFDRYGSKQRELWLAFKEDMAAVPFSEPQMDEIVDKAKEIFASFGKIGNEIVQTVPA